MHFYLTKIDKASQDLDIVEKAKISRINMILKI